ncbi:MAG: hypothetical protein AB7I36_20955 [Rhodospirillaceae bacterium]
MPTSRPSGELRSNRTAELIAGVVVHPLIDVVADADEGTGDGYACGQQLELWHCARNTYL